MNLGRNKKAAPGGNQGAAESNQSRRDYSDLRPWLQKLISSPPKPGEGVHYWLFDVARNLHAHRSTEDIFALLSAAVKDYGRPESEIRNAIADSAKWAWKPGSGRAGTKTAGTKPGSTKTTGTKAAPKWPAVNKQARHDIIDASGVTLADLRDSSPVPCDAGGDAEHYIDGLFSGDPLLCVGLTQSDFETAPRESFRGRLAEKSLIVPSPMSALTGRTIADGRESAHTLDNTGQRRYLVTEFDPPEWKSLTPDEQQHFGSEESYYATARDEQAAIISHLRQYGPLVMVLSSGGKSLHAWWNCEEVPDTELIRFMRHAVSLGADHRMWLRSQFARLPGGWRADKGRRQEVFYFDPASGKERAT